MTRLLVTLAALVAIYITALGSAAPADIALGAVFATLALWSTRAHVWRNGPRGPAVARHLLAFRWAGFASAVTARGIAGALKMAGYAMRPSRLPKSGLVEIPIEARTAAGVAVDGLTTSLTPGSVVIDIDRNRGVMILHLVDARDPERFAQEHRHFYERWQRYVMP